MNQQIETQLEQEFLRASLICREKYKYNPSYFLPMLQRLGPVKTVVRLVMEPTYHQGLTRLWELGRLDLTVEAIILREPYKQLFSPEVLNAAKTKLEKLGYTDA